VGLGHPLGDSGGGIGWEMVRRWTWRRMTLNYKKKMIKEFKKCLIANYYKKCKMVQKSEVMPCELDIQ
jgi:hypothetical protein